MFIKIQFVTITGMCQPELNWCLDHAWWTQNWLLILKTCKWMLFQIRWKNESVSFWRQHTAFLFCASDAWFRLAPATIWYGLGRPVDYKIVATLVLRMPSQKQKLVTTLKTRYCVVLCLTNVLKPCKITLQQNNFKLAPVNKSSS